MTVTVDSSDFSADDFDDGELLRWTFDSDEMPPLVLHSSPVGKLARQ